MNVCHSLLNTLEDIKVLLKVKKYSLQFFVNPNLFDTKYRIVY